MISLFINSMKKTFLFIIALALGANAMAIPNFVKVKLTSANGKWDELMLCQATDADDTQLQNGPETTKIDFPMSEPAENVYIYVTKTYDKEYKLASMYVTDLVGHYISFKTNATETNYTLSFPNVYPTGFSLNIIDWETKTLFSTADGSYAFTATAGQVFANRFQIVAPISVTTNAAGYATYSNSLDLTLVAGQTGDPKVCSATYSVVSDEEGILTLHAEDGVPANTGVIIRGAASTTYSLVPATVAPFTSTNVLEASVEETANPGALCMATIGGVCAFYEYTGAMVAANKAYLPLSILTEGGVLAPRRVRLVVEGATALSESEQKVMAEKVMVNGRILVRKNGQLFSVAGQLVK